MAQKAEKGTIRWIRRAPQGISVTAPARPRLGVLSGTFNPPTQGHLAIGHAGLAQLRLHEVLFVLPETPPHKQELEASLGQRADLLRLAVESEPRFSAVISQRGLLLEIHHEISYHYPPQTKYFFLTGRDAAERILLHWPYEEPERALEEMFARFEFGVADRGGAFQVPADAVAAKFAAAIHRLKIPEELEHISATRVRERIRRNEDVQGLVPSPVEAHIRAHGLYRRGEQPP